MTAVQRGPRPRASGGRAISLFVRGNRESERKFRDDLVEYLPRLRAVARTMLRSRDGADDLVHETVARALAAYSRSQFEPGSNLRAWLMTILRNQRISEIRRRRITLVEDTAVGALSVPPTQVQTIELSEIHAAMEKMSRRHRDVLMLVAASGMDQEEAARICKCAVGTIKSRLSRARCELHALLETNAAAAARRHASKRPPRG